MRYSLGRLRRESLTLHTPQESSAGIRAAALPVFVSRTASIMIKYDSMNKILLTWNLALR